METKEFHLGDILSITTERLVSSSHMGGVYDILNFMTGDNLFTHQLPRAGRECKPYLLEQLPQLGGVEMKRSVATLDRRLKATSDKEERRRIVESWLAEQVVKYGEYLPVAPIPTDAHAVKNPIVVETP
jgi:hypothetical protein